MNRENILKSDVLDIIFENRNKNYGAYPMRKNYGRRLFKALGIMMGLVLVLSAFTFLQPGKKTYSTIWVDIPDPQMGHPKVPEKKIVPEKPVNRQTVAEHLKFISNYKFVPNTDSTSEIKTLKSTDEISLVNRPVIGPSGTSSDIVHVDNGGGTGEPIIPVIKTIDKKTPLFSADIMPSYPGGVSALLSFLKKNLQNPKEMEGGELVSVAIRFVVSFDGSLKNFEVLQDGGEQFNSEVIRVLKKMPTWIPGKSNSGEDVSVYYNIPVKFVSAEYSQ